jgi:hypothetical protein
MNIYHTDLLDMGWHYRYRLVLILDISENIVLLIPDKKGPSACGPLMLMARYLMGLFRSKEEDVFCCFIL